MSALIEKHSCSAYFVEDGPNHTLYCPRFGADECDGACQISEWIGLSPREIIEERKEEVEVDDAQSWVMRGLLGLLSWAEACLVRRMAPIIVWRPARPCVVESIEWLPAEPPPDAQCTVLVVFADPSIEVEKAYFDGRRWREAIEEMELPQPPTHYAHPPLGPGRFRKARSMTGMGAVTMGFGS